MRSSRSAPVLVAAVLPLLLASAAPGCGEERRVPDSSGLDGEGDGHPVCSPCTIRFCETRSGAKGEQLCSHDGDWGSCKSPSQAELRCAAKVPDEGDHIELVMVGQPIWKPVDVQIFAAPQGSWLETFGCVLGSPQHRVDHDRKMILPGAAHGPLYELEISQGLARCGLSARRSFSRAEFQQGLIFATMIVPREGAAPHGKSPDFDNGLVLPEDLFPMVLDGDLFLHGAGTDWFQGSVMSLSRAQGGSSLFYSHLPLAISATASGAPATSGTFELFYDISDRHGYGWILQLPFAVRL